ncbi:MAG: hypothetical protein FD146_1908 [Anaerolineaceae bacterium]|nr:MAG: hypothetical protein FD146_1908 [Anaerolineaceae bacterium]
MRKFFAVILSILFVVTMLAAIVLYNIDSRLLSASTYKSALAGQQVYARIPRILAEQLTVSMTFNPCAENPFVCENITPEFKDCAAQKLGQERFNILAPGAETPTEAEKQLLQPCVDQFLPQDTGEGAGGPPPFMQSLTAADWETIIATLLPPDDLKMMAESLIDQTFAYLNGQQDTVTVSLVPLKNRISGQPGVDALLGLIRAQPPCGEAETDAMTTTLQGGSTPEIFCSPPEDKLQELKPDIQNMLANTAGTIPDEKVLLTPESGENSASGGLVGAFRAAHLILRLSPEVPLGILLLITLLAVRTPKSWLRWWGIPFFITGLLAAAAAVLMSFTFEQVWITLLASRIPPYLSLGLVELIRSLVRAVMRRLTAGILVGGLLFAIPGLGMWIGSSFVKPEPELQPEIPAP